MNQISFETKKESYEKILPTYSKRTNEVYSAIQHLGPCTYLDVAQYLYDIGVIYKPSPKHVSSYIVTLHKDNKIEVCNEHRNRNNRPMNVYRVVGDKRVFHNEIYKDKERVIFKHCKEFCEHVLMEIGSATSHELAEILYQRGILPFVDNKYTEIQLYLLTKTGKVYVSGKKYNESTNRNVQVFTYIPIN